MIADKGCAERGCACYDDRLGEVGVEMMRREWVGLTKDEIEILSYKADENTWKAVELAEAKLKEKNT